MEVDANYENMCIIIRVELVIEVASYTMGELVIDLWQLLKYI